MSINDQESVVVVKEIESKGLNYNEEQSNLLSLKNVEYKYDGGNGDNSFSIGPVDLDIFKGEILFITGGNGCGKSTLAKIICGLYHPHKGTILLKGKVVTNDDISNYREIFSCIFSDFFLFKELIGIDIDEIAQQGDHYIKLLKMEKKLSITDNFFSTIELSTGQRKRAAMITALLENREIYLFDEWAADQDPYFRKVFYETILSDLKKKNKTIIAITHDDRYFNYADRIVRLDDGEITSIYSTHELNPGIDN